MSARSLDLNIRINFPLIFTIVLILHAFLMLFKGMDLSQLTLHKNEDELRPLKIRNIRTVGARDSKIKSSTYLSKTDSLSKDIRKERFSQTPNLSRNNVAMVPKKSLSFSDLSVKSASTPPIKRPRPGTRPGVIPPRNKAINAISLKGNEIQRFAQDASTLSGDSRNPGLNNSDILVNLEVPEGVNPDELNKYELMFYSFQRRTAINYINSFYKHLDKFQSENPHLTFPMTDTKQVMTGRLTYDEKGNIKQIKMVRWSNIERLQDFFVDVLKDMDTLHNPPHALWEKQGEFTIFFSLVVNG